jgi:cation:H+ antiporter
MIAEFLSGASLAFSIGTFLLAAAIIGVFGVRMTYITRELAVTSGLGEAFMGAVFIGATTSLSGITASATAAWYGQAGLAVSNSLGGIAAQTLFLVLGDMLYRKANLEFAAASVENMMMSVQLMLLLCILLIAFTVPQPALFGIHPASLVLMLVYLFTLKLLVDTHEKPMWLPRRTRGTVVADAAKISRRAGRTRQLVLGFLVCAAAVAVAGWLMAASGMALVERT